MRSLKAFHVSALPGLPVRTSHDIRQYHVLDLCNRGQAEYEAKWVHALHGEGDAAEGGAWGQCQHWQIQQMLADSQLSSSQDIA